MTAASSRGSQAHCTKRLQYSFKRKTISRPVCPELHQLRLPAYSKPASRGSPAPFTADWLPGQQNADLDPRKERAAEMSDAAKDKAARLLKKRGSVSSLGSHEVKPRDNLNKPRESRDSMSTVSYIDEPGHHDDIHRPAVQMENTYQLGPTRRFPVATVNNILKDVLTSYLQEEKYEAELCRQMTKTISEVVKARVKDLMIPRYKTIVLIYIGQLNDQGMRVGSRCIWDPANDTFASYTFKNSSLFALANVYAVYYE